MKWNTQTEEQTKSKERQKERYQHVLLLYDTRKEKQRNVTYNETYFHSSTSETKGERIKTEKLIIFHLSNLHEAPVLSTVIDILGAHVCNVSVTKDV